MELTKERMLEIAKRRKDCDFCFTPEPCSECERGLKAENDELWEFYDRVIELLQADADGRCVVLPCKIGDSAWAITNYYGKKKPKEGIISEIYFMQDMRIAVALKGIARGEIGKNIFLTKEEALAELHEQWEKGLKGGAENARDSF